MADRRMDDASCLSVGAGRLTASVSSHSAGSSSARSEIPLTKSFTTTATRGSDHKNGVFGARSTPAVRWSNLKNAFRVTRFKTRKTNDVFLERFTTRRPADDAKTEDESGTGAGCAKLGERLKSLVCDVIDPDGDVVFNWLMCVTAFIIYNLWTIILREGFPEFNAWGYGYWLTLDVLADAIFVVDIAVQSRTGYLEHGIIVTDAALLAKKYLTAKDFWFDLAAVFPSDYLLAGYEHPIVRLPRLLKVYRFFRLSHMAETRTSYPNILRVVTLVHTLFLIVHWFAAFYYMISKYERHKDAWSFPFHDDDNASVTRQYLLSFYWATLTLTTIGDLPGPETNWQYVFQIASYMIGLFIFATIVGQVGNVISNYTASRQEFERQLDGAKMYMQRHGVPKDLQTRVQRWYDYAWTRNRMQAPCDINSLQLLPDKLKTELALHVNLETLRKVTIFDNCEPEFLHDLVLKMKSCLFTPGDLIVRKSEIAREMFIVADGVLEVLGDTGEVIANLTAGNFFGEIGILNLEGGINRRTADVRSVGYSDLFVLEREAVVMAIQQYPQAKMSLMMHAQQRLQEMKRIGSDKLVASNSGFSLKSYEIRPRDPLSPSDRDESQFQLDYRLCSDQNCSAIGHLTDAIRQCNENVRQLRIDMESYATLMKQLSRKPEEYH